MAGSHTTEVTSASTSAQPGNTLPRATVGEGFMAPLGSVNFEAIEDRLDICQHSVTHDLENHIKICVLEGVDPSDSLRSLSEKTALAEGVSSISASQFSNLTNGRPCRAMMAVLSEVLHSPQLSHCRAHLRNRLDWLNRTVVASDASNLSISAPITLPDELQDSAEDGEITPEDGGLKLHLATRVDGESKHPLAATITHPDTHETTQLDHLEEAVADFDDLTDPIEVWDRGFTDYDRFCEKKRAGEDFITTLKKNARTTVVVCLDEFEVTDEDGTRHVTDEVIELSDTGERFRRITLDDHNDDVTEYITTLPPATFDPIDVVSIYTLRTLIEIFFREGKQYLNFENFHSTTLNGVLFEVFGTLIAYLLVGLYGQRHPHKGGTRKVIRTIQIRWNEVAQIDYG